MKVLKVSLSEVLLTVAICLLVSCCLKPVEAVPLSNTEISWEQFKSIADISSNSVTGALTGFFDFETAAGNIFFPDGSVYSQVFPGIGSADGLNVYVYQFQVFLGSDVSLIEVSFEFPVNPENFPVDIASSVTSFWVNESDPEIGIGSGASVAPEEVTWDNGVLKFTLNLNEGDISFIIGVFAPKNMPPQETITKLGTVPEDASPIILPTVYMPTLEPSVVVCLGLGIFACLIRGRRSLRGFMGRRRE